jgi:hypothetical protein
MNVTAFSKLGNTIAFTANVTAPAPVQAVSVGIGATQYEVQNPSNVTVFLGYGTTLAEASNNAVVVTSTGYGYPLLPGTDKIISAPPNAFFTGITTAGTATVYVTPGEGL